VLKAHEFGRDVVLWAGDQHVREKLSIPRIHKRLVGDFHVPISERSVGNLVDDYVALCHCVAGDEGRVRERLQQQQGMVLCVDGVHFDGVSPVLYVQREVISGEVLYAERKLARSKDDLVPMLRRTAELAKALKIPILGVVSDKERSLVPAIAEVFSEIPHQFCQTHFLKNVAVGYKEDDQELARASKETVLALRDVQRTVERRFPTVAVGANRADKNDEEKETTKEPALAVATAVAEWARAGTIAGMVSGRAITDPPGLRRFQRLQQVREAMEEAVKAKRRTLHENDRALIEKVRDAFRPCEGVQDVANRLDRHVTIVREVARVLDTDKPGSQVKRGLRRYLNRLKEEAPRRGRGAATGHFVDHLVKVADSYWSGLFQTYDHPEVPRTTNAIEGFFGSTKAGIRSRTGRASTTGSKMDSCGEFFIEAQALTMTTPIADLKQRLQNVPDEDFVVSKRDLGRIREPARERRHIQRRLGVFLEKVATVFLSPPGP